MTLTRSQIRSNRLAWADFLEQPERKKARGILEDADDPEARCCLGHAAFLFGCDRVVDDPNLDDDEDSDLPVIVFYDTEDVIAPESLMEMLGLWTSEGGSSDDEYVPLNVPARLTSGREMISLAVLNDFTEATPQDIGAYIRTVVEGGEATPFLPLSDYPEG